MSHRHTTRLDGRGDGRQDDCQKYGPSSRVRGLTFTLSLARFYLLTSSLLHGHTTVHLEKVKVKAFPHSIPSVGPGADPGVQAVSPQVTVSHPPGSRLPLLAPGLRLPPQPHSITARDLLTTSPTLYPLHYRATSVQFSLLKTLKFDDGTIPLTLQPRGYRQHSSTG